MYIGINPRQPIFVSLIPVSVVNPVRIRYFAKANGKRAKTDIIDALILAQEIASLNWLMVCDSEGQLSQEINLINKASKGKQSGRIIPLHKDLAILLAELLIEQKKNEHFVLTNRIITTERTNKTSPQAIVKQNLHYHHC